MDVNQELQDIYHATVVATKGDTKAAERAKMQAAPRVQQFAALLERAADGGSGAANALKQAREILGQGGDPSSLDRWIHAHVDESVMREAGLDPTEIARSAGVEVEEPDVEQAGRDYREFTGDGNQVAHRDEPGQGMNVRDFSPPGRV
ncbi:MAG: hypothetical protein RMA76_28085 [Deltaproteobacteria bacterium]|jgi:hypothetical protein